MEKIPSKYDSHKVEDKWYHYWMKKGYFRADIKSRKEPYTIVIPPPNITGELHYGHALNNTLQDILIRWKRMEGYNTLWLPGTDHAGIATQNVVEKELALEGLTRNSLGREKFIKRVWEWKEKYGGAITSQLKQLGSSCDWSREKFTLDKGLSRAVKEVFVHLYKEGLIYRGNYIINWCPRCQTALSDLEVEYEEVKGHLYYIKYPLKEKGYVTVATTRPETMLGDSAVAIHPQDKRYNHLKGETVILPLVKREIPLITDKLVDPDFGTGAVKITPAHDPNDFEIGKRNSLPQINILNVDGTMNEKTGKYKGMDRFICRKELLEDLKKEKYLEKIEEHFHAVGHCYRCKTIIEPYLSRQWFVKMKEMAKPAIKAVEEGKVRFIPSHWTKTYFAWMNNIKDWCISRQIWWGHRMPVWYCQDCLKLNKEGIVVSEEEPLACPECRGTNLVQETDVLDTWFSSALWPFSTLGWPEKTADLTIFYPTSVLITAPEIIFFWVARMIMMSLKFLKVVPFKEVYIHATVRDEKGKKMSKSLGNVMNPLEVINKYGADSLRFSLAAFTLQGRDIYLSEERIKGHRNFVNKIWNAGRFVLINLEIDNHSTVQSSHYTLADKWILTRLNQVIEEVSCFLTRYEFGKASQSLYKFVWHEFCDWYLELVKPTSPRRRGLSQQLAIRASTQSILCFLWEKILRLLHPFIPFITEEIWQQLPHIDKKETSIMVSSWPKSEGYEDKEAVRNMELIREIIEGVRNIKGEMNIPPQERIKIILKVSNSKLRQVLKNNSDYIINLTRASKLTISGQIKKIKFTASVVLKNIEIYLPLEGLINLDYERERLSKKIESIEEKLKKNNRKLTNKDFLKKAPPEVIDREKEKEKAFKEIRGKLKENLSFLLE